MKRFFRVLALLPLLASAIATQAQTGAAAPAVVKGPDERFKTDILVVVAHPDDEGGVTPYLARAIYDEHKRVAVVYGTRGGSGGNDYSREHGPALADIREQEARQACAKLGITNVWFLGGKDTASQNVLNSLSNWGHGASLEQLVRIVRLTRPEVIISWLPGIFSGENHGDHQAAGVLATEAFDTANDPAAFPSQVSAATRRLELYLENLAPWQAKKLYFFSDADNQKQFDGTGPAYSIREISPSQKKPYWRLALDAATPHLTQFPAEIGQLSSMSDEQLNKFMDDPQHSWWTEPMTLVFGKSVDGSDANSPVFPALEPASKQKGARVQSGGHSPLSDNGNVRLGGPWAYYADFCRAHHLQNLPALESPEIAVKGGTLLQVPFVLAHDPDGAQEFTVDARVPEGWKVSGGTGKLLLPKEKTTALRVEVETPETPGTDSANRSVEITVEQNGKRVGAIRLLVLLKKGGLPQ